MRRDQQTPTPDAAQICGELLERLGHLEDRIDDLQRLADLQLENTADIKSHLGRQGPASEGGEVAP